MTPLEYEQLVRRCKADPSSAASQIRDLKAELEKAHEGHRACCPSDNHTCEHDPPTSNHCNDCYAMWVHYRQKISAGYYKDGE